LVPATLLPLEEQESARIHIFNRAHASQVPVALQALEQAPFVGKRLIPVAFTLKKSKIYLVPMTIINLINK